MATFTYVNLEGISTTTTLFKTAVTRASNGSIITLNAEYSFQSGDATTSTLSGKTLTIEGARIQTAGNNVTISGPWDLTYKTVSQLKGKSGGKITFSEGAKITVFETNASYGYAACNMQGNAILEVKDSSTFLLKPYYDSNNELVREGNFLNEAGGTVSVAGNSRFLSDKLKNTGSYNGQDSTIEVTDNSLFQIGTFDDSDNFTGGELTNESILTVTSSTFAAGIVTNSGSAAFTDSVATVGDAGNTALALDNTNQFSLISTGERNATLTVNGNAKSTKTFTVTTGAALSSVAVASSTEARTVSVVVKDSSDATIYSNDSFSIAANEESISIYSADFIVGETYSVTVAGESAGSKVATSGAYAALTVNGNVTNTGSSAVFTVDAGSHFSADSFTNSNSAVFKIVYQQDSANIDIASLNNSGGTIRIDVTEYLDNIDDSPSVIVSGITFSASNNLGTITLVDSKGRTDKLAKISYSLNANNELVLGPLPIFVNARWTNTESIPATVTYNARTYNTGTDVLAFGKVQDAINAAAPGTTIVFYDINPGGSNTSVEDFKFYPQGLVTVDKDLFFESNTTNKAVKIDSLKISTGCTVEFRSGLYSMEDFLDNEGGTLKIVDNTRFNADLIKNTNGTITLDKSSRLVAASIDAGTVEVRAGFAFNDLRWIERPYAAKIGDNVTIHLVYPRTEYSPAVQDGVVRETRIIEGKQYDVVVETINPGDQVYAKVVDGQYICYGTAAHHKDVGGTPQPPKGGGWNSFYAATEYGGLQLIDDEFDLNPDSGDTYSTAAIYVNNTTLLRTAELSATLEAASKTLTVNEAGLGNLAQGQYSCTVTAGDSILNGVFIVAVKDNVLKGTVNFVSNLAPGTYSIKVADPKFVATAAAGAEEGDSPFLTLTGTGLEAGDYRYSITTSDGILTGNCVVSDGGVTIENDGLAAGTAYTAVLTKNTAGSTFEANNQNLDPTDADHKVTVSTEYEDNPIVYDSFMGAMNSVYIDGHTIGTPDAGMVVRLQEGTYREGDFSVAKVQNSKVPLYIGTGKNIIVEPDRWMDEEGQWHYDNVSLILGGTFGQPESVNQMTFYKLKNLTVDSWVVGRDKTLAKNSVINFVDIEDLVINVRMKPQGGATVRILNCNVTSKMHFSVAGGTLIIENSYVKLTGSNGSGALSTENNYVGSGTVIVRNSVFELTDSTASDMVVNLKVNAEFTISGTCTVDGVFTNLDTSGKNTDTCISFRDAILDENTNIRAGTNDSGAALRFEGYNVLDGSTVVQKGNQDMTIEVGSTLDMSGGASITVGGGVDVSNCGNITLDNATISAGSFTNQGSLTLSDGAEITLNENGKFVNSENGTLTVELQSDGSLGISKGDGTPVDIENSGTIYIDLSKTDMPEDHPYIILEGLSGEGEVVVIGGGGEYSNTPVTTGGSDIPHINLFTPSTETLYVNGEWHNPSVYKRGKNVGSYTYFGYNAFDNNPDNDPGTNRDLKFTTETSKVVYYGGSYYTDLDLSAAANNAPNQLTITTLETMSTAKLTASFTVDAGDARTVSIVVKDAKGKIIEKQNYSVAASASSIENAVFYSSSLSASDVSGYTVSIVDAGVTTPLETTAWSVTDLSGDRDTATLASLTTDADQIVTLSGATIYLTAATNNGTLKVGTGESAILEIPVAPSGSIRDVKVAVKIGSNEEYHTVQAAAGESSVTVESKSFAPGQEYSVSLSDTKQYSAVSNTLSVDVVSGAARTINVVVRNADGVKYTFTNVEVGAGDTKVTLNPIDALDDTSATVSGSPAGITVTNYGGSLTLHVTGDVAAQKVDVYVQKTVGDTVYRFDYTFNVDAHTEGSEEKTYTVSTRLSSDGYYYVEASEPEITATAQVNGISGAQVKAGNVTNNGTGTIVVASQKDVGSLSLTGIQSAEARTIRVKIMDGDFTVGTYDVDVAGTSTSATVVSSDFIAEKTYTATVTDTLFQTVDPSGTGTAPKLTFALAGIMADTYAVQVTDHDSGDIIGNYTARRSGDTYTVVSDEFKAETKYTVSATIASEEVSQVVTSSEAEGESAGSASQLTITVGAGAARTVTAVVKDSSGNIVGTFDVAVAQNQTEISLVSSEFSGTGYTVSIANENVYDLMEGTPATIKHFEATAEAPRKSAKLTLDVDRNDSASRWIEVVTGGNTYSLFVEKGAKTAELESENFTVGTEYSDIRIKDAYSAAIEAKAGEGDTKTLTLTGLSSSDNVIRPDGPIVRTLKATVRDGAVVVDTYTITTIDSKGDAVISDSRLTAGKEYTVELSDEKTVVATAETLSVFDSTGTINYSVITVTDATFNAETLTNESTGTITLTNSQLNVSGTLTNNATTTALNPDYGIFMDIDSLITAGSITNNGTITIDATTFNPTKTDMKKVIDLETGALTGTGDLILNAAAGIGVLYDDAGHDYWVVAADQSTVYVNSAWATDENGLAHKIGDRIEDDSAPYTGKKLYYGYNAFSTFTDAYAETLSARFYTLDDEGKHPEAQTIGTIEVYGTPEAVDSTARDFRNKTTLTNLQITKSTADAATTVIPFTNAEGSVLTLIPANNTSGDPEKNTTITIGSGVTLLMNGTGSVHLGGDETTEPTTSTTTNGKVVVNGTIDAGEGTIVVYGLTEVNSGTLKAASLNVTNADLLTVSGVSTLDIDTLSGSAIQLQSGTELTDSDVTGGSINSAYDFTFGSNNSLYGVTLTAAGKTITNSGTLTIDVNSGIKANSFANTGTGTITIDTSAYSGSDVTLIDVNNKGTLSLSDISITEDIEGGWLVQKTDGDICILSNSSINRNVLYVNDAWKTGYEIGQQIDTYEVQQGEYVDRYFGINAFSSLDDITCGQAPNQTAKYTDTKEINFAAELTGTHPTTPTYRYFYAGNNDIDLTGSGETKIVYDRLYLMTAVADYDSNVATAAKKKFTVDSGLTITMETGHGLVKVGDVLDGNDGVKRTGGKADLQIDGILNAAVYVSPYSAVTVSADGMLIHDRNANAPTQGSYLRNFATMTVTGASTPVQNTPKQLLMHHLTFMDGGTLSLNSTRAQIDHFRFAAVQDRHLSTQDATITLDHAWLDTDEYSNHSNTELRYFFLYNWTDSTPEKADPDFVDKIYLNITNGSTLDVNGIFNPNAQTTVTVDNSTLNANSITNNGTITMDAASLITAGSITNTGAGKVEIDATDVSFTSGMKKVIDLNSGSQDADAAIGIKAGTAPDDVRLYYNRTEHDYWLTDADNNIVYVNGSWNVTEYGGRLAEKRYYGYNATNSGENAAAIAPAGATIEVTGGNFTTANAPTFNGVATTISGGNFNTSVCGGKFYTQSGGTLTLVKPSIGSSGSEANISLTINDGTFNKIVFAGDRVHRGLLAHTRTGSISTTITGGLFKNAVAGAMSITTDADGASSTLIGNVSLTIKGGTFDNSTSKSWIYGGSIATSKSIGANTTIEGNVTVTLDASTNNIAIVNLVAGSYGKGRINGNTRLVLTGSNYNSITATGEIWGGSSGDTILSTYIENSGNRAVESMVKGDRILTFTGFTGTLTANKIRDFSDIEVVNGSKATVANASGGSVDFSNIVNWTFGAPTGSWLEGDCMLTGDFENNFYGDTLNLTGFDTAGTFTLMSGDSLKSDDLQFNLLADIQMGGNSVKQGSCIIDENTLTWSWSAGSNTTTSESWLAGSLVVNKTYGTMTLTTTIA